VTYDHCTAGLVFRIDTGNFGEIALHGLKFALVIRSGKVMADGNWVFAGVVDERADEAQRRALAAIVGGQADGPPAFIREVRRARASATLQSCTASVQSSLISLLFAAKKQRAEKALPWNPCHLARGSL
jgi:hypothetical protein